ncbi:MAG: PH domain-containing protein [Actinobacteria bacterium]|nr:PH domain-containing protein [Actinomycetota bacterium]MCI0543990.1 PH domain-containing protein [Actinomycetota bacterium]
MGYPQRLLSEDEVIESEFRPHWSQLLREGLLVLAGIVLIVLIAVSTVPNWVMLAVAGVVLVLIANGVITWLTTQHVITNERVIFRAGFISKRGKEIPLEVVNDVAFNQTVFERIFGTGDLLIESAGTHGQSRYRDIPKPEEVQTLIYKVREGRMASLERAGMAPSAESRASQLETLSRLHDEGKLSDEEFEDEKRRLLGGG